MELPTRREIGAIRQHQARIVPDMIAADRQFDIVQRDLDVRILVVLETGPFRIADLGVVDRADERDVRTTPAERRTAPQVLIIGVDLNDIRLVVVDVEL